MNITPTMLYWFTRLDGVNTFIALLLGITASIFVIFFIAKIMVLFDSSYTEFSSNDKKAIDKIFKITCLALAFLIPLDLFIPTQKELAAIIVVPKVVNNEKVQNITSESLSGIENLVKLSNTWVEQQLKEKSKSQN